MILSGERSRSTVLLREGSWSVLVRSGEGDMSHLHYLVLWISLLYYICTHRTHMNAHTSTQHTHNTHKWTNRHRQIRKLPLRVTHPWRSQVHWAPLQGLWASAEQTPEAWPGLLAGALTVVPVLVVWAPEVSPGPPLVKM